MERDLRHAFFLVPLLLALGACGTGSPRGAAGSSELGRVEVERLEKSEDEWRAELTPEEFRVLREAGTERPFTGGLLHEKRPGTFTCAGCELPLFAAEAKFESGTGWPSFTRPVEPGHVAEELDESLGMVRTEVLCARCRGHLGHVFRDGPPPTGLRYCINSVALDFEPAEGE